MPIHVVVVVVVVLPSARGGADVVMVVVVESEWRGTLSFEVQHPREEVTWMLNSKPLSSTLNQQLSTTQTTSTTTNDTAPTRHRVTMPDMKNVCVFCVRHPPPKLQARKSPTMGAFLCLVPSEHHGHGKTTHVGLVFVFDAISQSLSMKTRPNGRVFVSHMPSTKTHRFGACFSIWHP